MLELLYHYGYFEIYPNFDKWTKNLTDYYKIKISTEKLEMYINNSLFKEKWTMYIKIIKKNKKEKNNINDKKFNSKNTK